MGIRGFASWIVLRFCIPGATTFTLVPPRQEWGSVMPMAVNRNRARLLVRLTAGLGLIVLLIPATGIGQGAGQPVSEGVAEGLPALPLAFPVGKAQEKADGQKDKNTDTRPLLTLADCLAIALEHQPSLKAAILSQKSTSASQNALNNIQKIGELFSPDLPIRKQQAASGQVAASADIQKVHNDIVYDTTRLYYTIVYARQQEQIADNVVATLERLVEIGKIVLDSPMPGDMTKAKLDQMKIGLAEAKSLRLTAVVGRKQAYAGLREVMGVDAGFLFRVQEDGLPVMSQKVTLTREQAIEMALARRPELTLAAAGVDAFRLEVYAQAKIPFRKKVPTLAAGADIHGRHIPQGIRERDYRPEPIVPEMPTTLVGNKYDRVCKAMVLSQRAEAVYEKARNLVILEAENGFFTLELAAEKLVIAKEKYADAKDLMDRVLENIDNLKSQKDQLVLGYVTASRAQSDYVTAVYDYILALAAMERITAGGLKPSFPGR